MNKYIKIFFFLFIAGSLLSCDLDRFPAADIAREESLLTIQDARNWENGIMIGLRQRQNGVFAVKQEVQADLVNATHAFGNRMGDPHRWNDFESSNQDLGEVWYGYFEALSNINNLINEAPGLDALIYANPNHRPAAVIASERAELARIVGVARLARAFYKHELALRWASAYNPATSATALGIPLVTAFDLTAMPARATLRETYEFILADIAAARAALAEVAPPTTGVPVRFNRDVVEALEARVRLYMQDWTGAITAANRVIATGRYPLVNTAEGMMQMWRYDTSSEIIMQAFTSSVELPRLRLRRAIAAGATTLSIMSNLQFLGFQSATNTFQPDFLPTQGVVDLFDADDIRRGVYFDNTRYFNLRGDSISGIYLISKFRGNPNIAGSATNADQAPLIFRAAEMHLIVAEASFEAGNAANALAALNTLRTARGLTALTGISGDVLRDEIRDERTRELAFEGRRLFDLRRWNLPMTRKAPQVRMVNGEPNLDHLSSGAGFYNLSIPAGNHRFIWGIPANDMMMNPNLYQNPGWEDDE